MWVQRQKKRLYKVISAHLAFFSFNWNIRGSPVLYTKWKKIYPQRMLLACDDRINRPWKPPISPDARINYSISLFGAWQRAICIGRARGRGKFVADLLIWGWNISACTHTWRKGERERENWFVFAGYDVEEFRMGGATPYLGMLMSRIIIGEDLWVYVYWFFGRFSFG